MSSPVLVQRINPAGDVLEKTTGHSNITTDSNLSLSEASDCEYELPPDVAERLVKRTEMRVSQVLSQSEFVQKHCKLYDLPRFEREDMEIGEMIAYGGFSNVHEIISFRNENSLDKKKQYIIKNLNPKLAFNPKKLVVGAYSWPWTPPSAPGISGTGILSARPVVIPKP